MDKVANSGMANSGMANSGMANSGMAKSVKFWFVYRFLPIFATATMLFLPLCPFFIIRLLLATLFMFENQRLKWKNWLKVGCPAPPPPNYQPTQLRNNVICK